MDLLPLSYINQYAYCARRFWYMYVQAEMVENVHVLRGCSTMNGRIRRAMRRSQRGDGASPGLAVYSHRLGITGVCDLVEEHADGDWCRWSINRGSRGKWNNDQAQLCAQALCLEEMTADKKRPPITHGFIFYFGSRRRGGGGFYRAAAHTDPGPDSRHAAFALALDESSTPHRSAANAAKGAV